MDKKKIKNAVQFSMLFAMTMNGFVFMYKSTWILFGLPQGLIEVLVSAILGASSAIALFHWIARN